jgi:hypothetical protein
MDMPDTCSPEFMEYETVQRYADSLGDDLTEKERGQRLAVLEEFSTYVGDTPDEMVEKIFNKETRKYRKRGPTPTTPRPSPPKRTRRSPCSYSAPTSSAPSS